MKLSSRISRSQRMKTTSAAHRGIMPQVPRTVHVLVSRGPAKYRLPQKPSKRMTASPAGARGRASQRPSWRTKPVAKTHRQCEIQTANRGKPAANQDCRLTQTPAPKFGDTSKSEENYLQIRSKFSRFGPLAVVAGLLTNCPGFTAMAQEPMAYIEPWYGPRFYLGDEDTRLGQAHLQAIMGWRNNITAGPSKRLTRTAQPGSVSRPLTTGSGVSTWRISPTGTPFGSKAKTISSSITGAIPTS
jgi:hypothetical protein